MKKTAILIVPTLVGIILGALLMHFWEQGNKDSISMNAPHSPVEELRKKVLLYGDTSAYRELATSALDDPPENFLFWSLYMANKYNYANAYWDVYFSMEEAYKVKFGDSAMFIMDDKTRKFSLQYLKLAAQKGDSSAIDELSDLKEKNVPID